MSCYLEFDMWNYWNLGCLHSTIAVDKLLSDSSHRNMLSFLFVLLDACVYTGTNIMEITVITNDK